MYLPFAETMNYALEQLSDVKVEGLPEFKSHIAFVPCDAREESDCGIPGSEVKPDLVIMQIQDAYGFYGLNQAEAPTLSQYVAKIKGRLPPDPTDWKTVLSAVELVRGPPKPWPRMRKKFTYQRRSLIPAQRASKRLNEKLDHPRSATRKMNVFLSGHTLTRVHSVFFNDSGII